jgi:quercetin 2,3-dioxygenase
MPLPHTNPQCFIVRADQDRHERPGHIGPDINRVKISATDTNGALAVLAHEGRAPGGPPLHMHPNQDEIFIVQDGRYQVQCGDDRMVLTAGDTIFLPHGIPHTFSQNSVQGRLLYMFTPAGGMEAFFAALAKIDEPPPPAAAAALFATHGVEVVGPPLALD